MLNKKETITVSLVLLEKDLKTIDKLVKEIPNFTRSDFIRIAIVHELQEWTEQKDS